MDLYEKLINEKHDKSENYDLYMHLTRYRRKQTTQKTKQICIMMKQRKYIFSMLIA